MQPHVAENGGVPLLVTVCKRDVDRPARLGTVIDTVDRPTGRATAARLISLPSFARDTGKLRSSEPDLIIWWF